MAEKPVVARVLETTVWLCAVVDNRPIHAKVARSSGASDKVSMSMGKVLWVKDCTCRGQQNETTKLDIKGELLARIRKNPSFIRIKNEPV